MSEDVLMLRMGFAHGLYSRSDVRAWVDQQIGLMANLPAELLDLATMAHRDDEEVIALLKGLERDLPELTTVRAELVVLGELYHRGTLSMAMVIHELAQIASQVEGLPEDEKSAIHSLDDGLGLAGQCGTIEDVRRDLEEFVSRYPFGLRESNDRYHNL
jgi:hypothetical protein